MAAQLPGRRDLHRPGRDGSTATSASRSRRDGGREIEDIRLSFERWAGRAGDRRARQEYFDSTARYRRGRPALGEFAFGTNYGIQRFTKNILFDEKIGGTIHMALGARLPGDRRHE